MIDGFFGDVPVVYFWVWLRLLVIERNGKKILVDSASVSLRFVSKQIGAKIGPDRVEEEKTFGPLSSQMAAFFFSLSLTHTHTHTHSTTLTSTWQPYRSSSLSLSFSHLTRIHTRTNAPTHAITLSLSLFLSLSLSFSHAPTHPITLALSLTYTHSHTPTYTLSLTLSLFEWKLLRPFHNKANDIACSSLWRESLWRHQTRHSFS